MNLKFLEFERCEDYLTVCPAWVLFLGDVLRMSGTLGFISMAREGRDLYEDW